jgi:hypothetical protein
MRFGLVAARLDSLEIPLQSPQTIISSNVFTERPRQSEQFSVSCPHIVYRLP